MPPVIISGGGLRLLVAALPITVLALSYSLVMLLAMFMPADRRRFVLDLAPYLAAAIGALAGTAKPPALDR